MPDDDLDILSPLPPQELPAELKERLRVFDEATVQRLGRLSIQVASEIADAARTADRRLDRRDLFAKAKKELGPIVLRFLLDLIDEQS